jgi:DNA polymerase-1
LDFETSDTNKYTCKIVGCGLQLFDPFGKVPPEKAIWTNDPETISHNTWDRPIVMHNAGFDLHLLGRLGIRHEAEIHDTYLMAKHYHNRLPYYDLKSLAWLHFSDPYLPLLAVKNWFRRQKIAMSDDDSFDLTLPPRPLVEAYCLHDVAMTIKLVQRYWPGLKDNYSYDLDRKCIPHVEQMMAKGIQADGQFYLDYIRRGKRRIKYNRSKAQERMGTGENPMGKALLEHLTKLGEERKTKTGKIASSEVVLRSWEDDDDAVGSVMRVRNDTKTINTYAVNILKVLSPEGRFHAGFMQSGADTRRFRARGFYGENGIVTKGNMQNFGEVMREGIVVPPGFEFWKMDLASIEARMFSGMMSMLMGEDHFAKLYREDDGFNVYLHVLAECAGVTGATKKHELYVPYKHGTLGKLYGSSAKRFAIQLKDDFNLKGYTEESCAEIYRNINRRFPFIQRFQRMLTNLAETQGYVEDPFGSRYYIDPRKPYVAVAYLCQGSAGVVLKWWWVEMSSLLLKSPGDYIFNTVHDEFDLAMRKKGNPKKRVAEYAGVLKDLDIFDIPILAEVKGPVSNWKEAG